MIAHAVVPAITAAVHSATILTAISERVGEQNSMHPILFEFGMVCDCLTRLNRNRISGQA
jgi:hypothetical protein